MTDQAKIRRDGATRLNDGNSLLERASNAYGFGALAPASTPSDLPKPEKRLPRPEPAQPKLKAENETDAQQAARPSETLPPQAEVAQAGIRATETVRFAGPRVSIDRDHLRDGGLLVPEDDVTGLLEEFRIVKRELLADARADGSDRARQILVSSPHPGEGKTYCAVNLAIAMAAERDLEVLLVDADVVQPELPSRLGFKAGTGLMDALADPALQPEKLVVATDIENLFVLPAGSRSSRAAEFLASARTGDVLARLIQGAPNRIAIFDTPPALAASAAAELAAHVGQAVLVARADETSRAALEDARQLLSACADIKLLLNAAQFSPSGRQFGDYGAQEE